PSSFDHRHLISASGTWEIPFNATSRTWQAIGAGWRLNGVFLAQAGAPFTVNLGVDQANIGGGPAQRPDQLRDANLPGDERRVDRWFDTSAFALPAPFTFGSARRNSVVGPGYASLDVSIAKGWSLANSR